jgi:hypothetical protein
MKFGQSLWMMARGQIQSSDTRSIVRSIFEQCCATLLITLLDFLLMQGIELCVKHWRFFGYFKWFWGFSCRQKLRSDASSDKFSDSCLSRGRIRTKSLRLGNPIVRTIFLKGRNWYLTSQPIFKGPRARHRMLGYQIAARKLWRVGDGKSTRARTWLECITQKEAQVLAAEEHRNGGHLVEI